MVYKKGTIPKWEGQASLKNKIVSWERGYNFHKEGVVRVSVRLHEFSKLENALKMLAEGRVGFILDYHMAINRIARELGIADQVGIVPDVIKGPKYYMVFSGTEKGRKLSQVWDKGMERLHGSGQLRKMYEQYEDTAY